MYNLLVTAEENAWEGKTYSLDISRCIRMGEYTSEDLATRFGTFTPAAIEQLKTFPCLFAYEEYGGDPRFGFLKNIKKRADQVIMECEYMSIDPWISVKTLHSIQGTLDIRGWELSSTHWAVKDVDLAEELFPHGIIIPVKGPFLPLSVNPEHHLFDVAFSFPGEVRPLVEEVVVELQKKMDPNDIF